MSRTHTTRLGAPVLLAAVVFGGQAVPAADSAGWQIDLKYGQSTSLVPTFGFIADTDDFSDTDLLTALGLRYRFGKSLGALVEYQRLDLDLDSTTVGVTWKF